MHYFLDLEYHPPPSSASSRSSLYCFSYPSISCRSHLHWSLALSRKKFRSAWSSSVVLAPVDWTMHLDWIVLAGYSDGLFCLLYWRWSCCFGRSCHRLSKAQAACSVRVISLVAKAFFRMAAIGRVTTSFDGFRESCPVYWSIGAILRGAAMARPKLMMILSCCVMNVCFRTVFRKSQGAYGFFCLDLGL